MRSYGHVPGPAASPVVPLHRPSSPDPRAYRAPPPFHPRYATSRRNPAGVEAAAAQPWSVLRASPELAVHVHPTAVDVSIGTAAQGRERWWSLEWSVATTLVTGDLRVSPETPVSDEALRD